MPPSRPRDRDELFGNPSAARFLWNVQPSKSLFIWRRFKMVAGEPALFQEGPLPGEFVRRTVRRWRLNWSDALASSAGAGLAWVLAQHLLGHSQPIFAAVAAIVCLAPGLPNRGQQAVHMMIGLLVGIATAEILLLVPVFSSPLRIAIIGFTAIMVALSFGLAPVIPIQSGVSAILVITMGPVTAGPMRLLDAAIGAGVALVFSQILLTPNPVRLIEDAAGQFLQLLAQGFAQEVEAIAEQSEQKARDALRHFFNARDSLSALTSGIAVARSNTRWSLRGRLVANEVADRVSRYDRRAIRLYASTLLFAEALSNALHSRQEPMSWIGLRVEELARTCRNFDGAGPLSALPTVPHDVPREWQTCVAHLQAIEQALQALRQTSMTAGEASQLRTAATTTPASRDQAS